MLLFKPMDSSLIIKLFLNSYIDFFKMWQIWLPTLVLVIFAIFLRVSEDKLIYWISKNKREQRYKDTKTIEELRKLNGTEFEEFVAHLFEKLGYKITLTGGTNDGGIDLIATKDGKKHFIQCKKYNNNQVSVGAVRDFYGAISDNMKAEGHFITTSFFTLEAKKFAEGKPIDLIDQFRLLGLIKIANNQETKHDICPLCSGLLTLRKGKFGKFFGCSNFPKCKYTTSNI